VRILLDTCAFLWFIDADPALSAAAEASIIDAGNEILLSIASVWEIAIKYRAGKLDLDIPPTRLVPRELAANAIELLPISLDHVLATCALPLHHRDPFDRLLIAQCLAERLQIVSADRAFDSYGVQRLW